MVKSNTLILLAATLSLVASATKANSAGAPPPDSGSLLQQTQPVKPVLPSPNNTGLVIDSQLQPNAPAGAPFMVNTIEIVGNTIFSTETLHDLVAEFEGKQLTLRQLNEAAGRLSNYYHEHGYPLARAYIPAQTIHDGIVRIAIVEAHYGQLYLDNHSLINDAVLLSTLAPLKSGSPMMSHLK